MLIPNATILPCPQERHQFQLLSAGSLNGYLNTVLETLLLVDMLVSLIRAVYNEQSVLQYKARDIRTRYLQGTFFLDLVAAVPFSQIVSFGSSVHNNNYEEWLRLPKMLRAYRLYRCVCLSSDTITDKQSGTDRLCCCWASAACCCLPPLLQH